MGIFEMIGPSIAEKLVGFVTGGGTGNKKTIPFIVDAEQHALSIEGKLGGLFSTPRLIIELDGSEIFQQHLSASTHFDIPFIVREKQGIVRVRYTELNWKTRVQFDGKEWCGGNWLSILDDDRHVFGDDVDRLKNLYESQVLKTRKTIIIYIDDRMVAAASGRNVTGPSTARYIQDQKTKGWDVVETVPRGKEFIWDTKITLRRSVHRAWIELWH